MKKCVVKECTNNSSIKARDIFYHRFPKKGKQKWIDVIRRNLGNPNWLPGKWSLVCSDHFNKTDFTTDKNGRRQLLSKKYPTKLNQNPTAVTRPSYQPTPTRPSYSKCSIIESDEAGVIAGPQTVVNIMHASLITRSQKNNMEIMQGSSNILASDSEVTQPAEPEVQTRNQEKRNQITKKKNTAQSKPVQMQSVAIKAANDSFFTEQELKNVESYIINELHLHIEANHNFVPEFDGSSEIKDGMIKLVCRNNETINWLKNTVLHYNNLHNRPLIVQLLSDIINIKCGILIHKHNCDDTTIKSELQLYNKWAGVEKWNFERASQQQQGTYYTVSIPSDLLPLIKERQCRLNFELGSVNLEIEEDFERVSKTEPDLSFSSSPRPSTSGV